MRFGTDDPIIDPVEPEFEGPVLEDPEETPPPVVQAQFPGECGMCGEPFQDGDEIYPDGSGGWAAVECCGEDVGL